MKRRPSCLPKKLVQQARLKQSSKKHQGRKAKGDVLSPNEVQRCEVVGRIFESDAEHLRRHPVSEARWLKDCARCRYLRGKVDFIGLARFGSHSFLAPRPLYLGGFWALGCALCAAAAASTDFRQQRAKLSARGLGSRMSKWASYSVRRVNADIIRAHSSTISHREAARSFSQPQIHLNLSPKCVAFGTEAETNQLKEDLKLVKGRVPQPEQWVDAWARSSSLISFRKMERVDRKKGLADGCRNLRRIQMKCVLIMAEVVRQEKRQTLRKAASITVACDDCGAFKVLRYRCDCDGPPWRVDGIIGAIKVEHERNEGADALLTDFAKLKSQSILHAPHRGVRPSPLRSSH